MNSCVAFVATVAVTCWSAATARAAEPEINVSAKLTIDRSVKVGSRQAGMLCFPNGSMQVSDFVRSDRDLSALAAEAFASLRQNQASLGGKPIYIELRSIKSKLCARQYGVFGMGDRQAFSGRVEFHYSWVMSENAMPQDNTIVVESPRDSSRSLEEITLEGLTLLAAKIAAAQERMVNP